MRGDTVNGTGQGMGRGEERSRAGVLGADGYGMGG